MNQTAVVPQNFLVVTLGTRDIARQRRFYEAWGWEAAPYSGDDYVAFAFPSATVAFFEAGKLAEEAGAPLTAPGEWNGVTLAVAVSEKDDVHTTWQAAVDAGATPVSEPVDRVWGGRSGYVADPDGNRWEIAWIPPMAGGPASEGASS